MKNEKYISSKSHSISMEKERKPYEFLLNSGKENQDRISSFLRDSQRYGITPLNYASSPTKERELLIKYFPEQFGETSHFPLENYKDKDVAKLYRDVFKKIVAKNQSHIHKKSSSKLEEYVKEVSTRLDYEILQTALGLQSRDKLYGFALEKNQELLDKLYKIDNGSLYKRPDIERILNILDSIENRRTEEGEIESQMHQSRNL